jgi:hypothetical protein
MSLPKKKKKLGEPQPNGGQSTEKPAQEKRGGAGHNIPPAEATQNNIMSEQMEKAFEMVDNIEHVHPLPHIPVSGDSTCLSSHTKNAHENSDPAAIRLNLSIGTPPAEATSGDLKEMPVINLHVKIPSFLWKVPIINGMARTIIRKLTNE